ncbi:Chromosome segregation in meiosis protein 3 [Penicillium rolfsii]|nr:Chromosome segregation in meiosis protein 3 [Penicillium rolfsii]
METSPERGPSSTNVDDLFDYDVGLEDIQPQTTPATNAPKQTTGDPTSLGLGLDEEVKVTRKRQPAPKLDEARLLSQPGIPKLRRTAKRKLRFQGKGHEYQDAERLLNFYQLWLDDLYPRAKFADGLSIIEKLGHTKRIQVMRREWIEEEKPKPFGDTMNTTDSHDHPTRPSDQKGADTLDAPASAPSGTRTVGSDDQDLFMPDPETENRPPVSHPEPDYDELDDLLREQDEVMSGMPEPSSRAPNTEFDDFDAEYEAMNDFGL